jgi:hypothetical protein
MTSPSALRLLLMFCVSRSRPCLPGAARIQPLAAGEVDQIQRALAHLSGMRVRAADAQREHGVRARRALVHQRRRDRAPRVCHRKESANLGGRAELLDYDVGDARRPFLVLDLVLLLVELTFSEEVIDGFVILCTGSVRYRIRGQGEIRTISRN